MITQMKLHGQMITHSAAHAQYWCCKIFAVDYLLVTFVAKFSNACSLLESLTIYCNLFVLNVDKMPQVFALGFSFSFLFSFFFILQFFFSQLKLQLVQYAGEAKAKLLLVVAFVSADQRNDLSLRIKVTFLGISVVHRRFLSTQAYHNCDSTSIHTYIL